MPNRKKTTKRRRANKKRTRRTRRVGGNDPRQVDVAIGMVQSATYDPTVYDDSSPVARDGMRLNGLTNLRGLQILSFDKNYAMGVSSMHIGADVSNGRRLSSSMRALGPVNIRDIYVEYHRFPSEYFMQMIVPFLGESGGLVNSLYPHQDVGGKVYVPNVNGHVLELVNKSLITSLYNVSFIDADANPLSQATSNIAGLRDLNEGELDKLLTPKFILLTKKESSISSSRKRGNGDYEAKKKVKFS